MYESTKGLLRCAELIQAKMEFLTSSLSNVLKEAEDDIVWNFMAVVKTLGAINSTFECAEEKSDLRLDNWKLFDRIGENLDNDNHYEKAEIRLPKDIREFRKLVPVFTCLYVMNVISHQLYQFL